MAAGEQVEGRCSVLVFADSDFYNWVISIEDEGSHQRFRSREIYLVRDAINNVREQVDDLITSIDPDQNYHPDDIASTCANLSNAGRVLSEALFGDGFAAFEHLVISRSIKLIELAVLGSIGELPIEFCCFSEDDAGLYLGERACVLRKLESSRKAHGNLVAYAGAIGAIVPRLHGPWTGIYAEDGQLGSAAEVAGSPRRATDEATALAPIAGDGLQRLHFLGPLDRRHPPGQQAEFQRWLALAQDVIHVNAEAQPSGLRVRDRAVIGPTDLPVADELGLTQGMLVFLNACSTALKDTRVENSMAAHFWQSGAETVACTTGVVDDSASTLFVRAFYNELSKPGTTAAEALLEARRQVKKKLHHPMANLFTLLGNPNYTMRKVTSP